EARALVDSAGADGELRRLLAIRVPELIEYQDAAYARAYVEFVTRVQDAERAATPGTTALGEAVARHLFKLMAYKDEYEVARLHLQNDLAAALKEQYPDGVTIHYNLHPPMLRARAAVGALGFEVQPSVRGRARCRLPSLRARLAPSRCSRGEAVGRVAVRWRGRTSAAAINARTLSRASSRFRAWLRVTWLVTTRRPSASSRWRARVRSRSRAGSGKPSIASSSTRRSIFVATLFTFWPPGPEARTARTVSADAGTRTVSLT